MFVHYCQWHQGHYRTPKEVQLDRPARTCKRCEEALTHSFPDVNNLDLHLETKASVKSLDYVFSQLHVIDVKVQFRKFPVTEVVDFKIKQQSQKSEAVHYLLASRPKYKRVMQVFGSNEIGLLWM